MYFLFVFIRESDLHIRANLAKVQILMRYYVKTYLNWNLEFVFWNLKKDYNERIFIDFDNSINVWRSICPNTT